MRVCGEEEGTLRKQRETCSAVSARVAREEKCVPGDPQLGRPGADSIVPPLALRDCMSRSALRLPLRRTPRSLGSMSAGDAGGSGPSDVRIDKRDQRGCADREEDRVVPPSAVAEDDSVRARGDERGRNQLALPCDAPSRPSDPPSRTHTDELDLESHRFPADVQPEAQTTP